MTVHLPYLKPTDMLDTISSTEPRLLFGGLQPGPSAHKMLATFWQMFKAEHGSHEVYNMAEQNLLRLDKTIPLLLHGDAGRTLKKTTFRGHEFSPRAWAGHQKNGSKMHLP